MIYNNLKGGLGNMLFQIAAAKSLSIDYDTSCYFPNLIEQLNYLDNDKTYNPKLNHSVEYLELLKKLEIGGKIPINANYIKYPFEYLNIPLNKEDTIIDGFFQSEKYFKHNRTKIINFLNFDFIDKNYINDNYNFLNIKNCTSIHVRRGDYLSLPNHHPVQLIDYYLESINILKEKTELFVVFSDDISWCKENIKIENIIYIENEKDYIELYLMSLCKNNIISNSSFSWWGAWLNENNNKIVIGPKKWFGPNINNNTNDIIPEDWLKI